MPFKTSRGQISHEVFLPVNRQTNKTEAHKEAGCGVVSIYDLDCVDGIVGICTYPSASGCISHRHAVFVSHETGHL